MSTETALAAFAVSHLADDIAKLREALAEVKATSYEVDDIKHVEALGSLTASVAILLGDLDAAGITAEGAVRS